MSVPQRSRITAIFTCATFVLIVETQALAQWGGTDLNLDPASALQNEISLALIAGASPGSPQVLLAAYNDTPFPGGNPLGVSRSADGGVTWAASQLSYPISGVSGAMLSDAFDPSATMDTAGNLFVAHISTDGASAGVSGLYVWRSSDGALTWNGPVEVAGDPASALPGPPDPAYRFNDRCQITADRFASSSRRDDVYVAWIKDRGWYTQASPPPGGVPPPSDIYFSRSTDNGVSFSPAVIVNDIGQNLGNMPVARVAADGSIYLTWLEYDVWNGGSGKIYLDRSTDGGVTWGTDTLVATIALPPINVTTASGATDARAKGAPVPATSPTNASELYLVYAADPDGPGLDEADIYVIVSTDAGQTWSTPLRLNSDATTNDQIMPWMDVAPDGTIVVDWYDRRNDAPPPPLGDQLWDFYIAYSTDGGSSFTGEARVNDQSFVTAGSGTWMGEYPGLVVESGNAYMSWTTSVLDSAGDVYFDRTSVGMSSPCSASPASGCRQAAAGASRVLLKDNSVDAKDRFLWKWSKGAVTNVSDFSDPVAGSASYHVCLYDSSAAAQPLMDLSVAPGGTCATKPCWKLAGTTGFAFKDKAAAQYGITVVRLKAGATGKAKVVVKGANAALPTPTLPLTTAVTAQLLIDDGATVQCWQTTFSAAALRNDATTFLAKQ
ncbi:MAG: exo-alpha-sialidase [Deltaproteobacteria bacterium]|nr:exo-alpha-sialidase [Deltaproteobacteria bacterium]